MNADFSRRRFLGTMAAAAVAPGTSSQARAAEPERFPLITFTKPFQGVGFERTAELVAEVGWSGIECPVRAKGQVLPERVEDDLPRLHEVLAKRGLTLPLITTDILQPNPLGERVLRAAAKVGVKRYRLGYFKYDLTKPLLPQLAEAKAKLHDLVALNQELGLQAGYQNHHGNNYLGAAVWDVYEMVREVDPSLLGICFDLGHATVEGGTSWPIEARLMEPHLTCVYVKDFAWEKGAKGWEPKWGPLGEGMVRQEFFTWLKKSTYRGPISQHCEYLEGDGPEQIALMKKDVATLRSWLA